MAFNHAQIAAWQQGSDVAPVPDGLEMVTSPMSINISASARLLHFAEDVYDLSAESHLVKLLKVLLGGAGVGGIQRGLLLVRMQQTLGSTHFFDLDAFYGAVLGARRNSKEVIPFDPVVDVATPEQWQQAHLRDAEYRGRIARFATSVHRGTTVGGVRGVAEALLGARCDIFESWMEPQLQRRTWAQADTMTWAQTDLLSWDQMTYDPLGEPATRNLITVRASVPLTHAETFDLDRALDRIRPATSSILVEPSIGSNSVVVPAKVFADSARWDVRQQVRNVNFRGLLLSPDDPEGEFISTVMPAWADYQGEAWSLLVLAPAAVAYSTPEHPDTGILTDPVATQTPPQEFTTSTGVSTRFVPEFALADIRKILAGRAASESIISESAYYRAESDSLRVGGDVPAIRPSTVANQASLVIDGVVVVTDEPDPPVRVRGGSFWTSPPRLATDLSCDVLEIRFSKAVTFNVLSLKVSSFPAAVSIEAWDPTTGTWINLAQRTISRAVPYTIHGTVSAGELHPYHQGPGHWTPLTFSVAHTTATHLRVVFDRIEAYGPVGPSGRPTPYPVAVRDLDVGFRVRGVHSLASAFPLEPVATTVNSWGIDVLHSLVINDAGKAVDGSEDTSWICDAQAAADAVVCFYLDVTTPDTEPSTFDELMMVPTHTGPTFNVYYSMTDPTTVNAALAAPEDNLVEPSAIVGSVVAVSTGDKGFSFASTFASYIDLDTGDFGMTVLPTDWWVGVEWYQGAPAGTTRVFSLGNDPDFTAGTLSVTNHRITASIGHWSSTIELPENPSVNDRLAAVVVLVAGVPETKVLFRNTVYEADLADDNRLAPLYLAGSATQWASAPDSPAFIITTDMVFTAHVVMDDVSDPTNKFLWCQRTTTATGVNGYIFSLNGLLYMRLSMTGGTATAISALGSLNGLAQDGVPFYARVTVDVDNEADGWTMTGQFSTDGITWINLNNNVPQTIAGAFTGFDSPAAMQIGRDTTGSVGTWPGRIYEIEARAVNLALLVLPGVVGNYFSTPHTAALNILGDLCVVARITPVSWAPGVPFTIAGKYTTIGAQRSWRWSIGSTGQWTLVTSPDGSTPITRVSGAPVGGVFATGTTKYVAFTIDVDNGAAGNSSRFWSSDDGVTFTQFGGTGTLAGVTSLYGATNAPVEIGTIATGTIEPFQGTIHSLSVRNGIGASGTVGGTEVFAMHEDNVALPDPGTPPTSFRSTSGHTVTINKTGDNVLVQPRAEREVVKWRFDAEDYESGTTFVSGDHEWAVPTTTTIVGPVQYDDAAFSRLRIGSGDTSNGFRLTRLAMGRGVVIPEDFFTQPDAYTRNVQGVDMAVPGIFLRYHPDYYGHLTDKGASWGFMGTIQDPWDLMVWEPIGQYVTTRGPIQFDQVRARFIKLEFSNLTIEPYDSLTVKQRAVKRFPRADRPPSGRTQTPADLAVINDVAVVARFPDSHMFFEGRKREAPSAPSATSGLVLIDSARRAEIGARTGYGFGLMPWQPGSTMPMFSQAGSHVYANMIIEPTTRSAYFVGLKEIEVRRRNVRDMGDTPVYFDKMLTVDNIDTSTLTMNFEPGQAFTTEAASNAIMTMPESITSLPYYSYSSVTAVQIATQQTGPQQMIPDDEFSSPSLPGSTFDLTNGWMPSGDAALLWDGAYGGVRVTRDPEPLSSMLLPDTPVVHPPPSPVVSSSGRDITAGVGYGLFGGITSPQVQVSPRGTLSVGARIFADREVGDDLFLRIYGSDGTTLLAEQRFHPQVGVATEVFLNYQLGSNPSKEISVQARVEQNGPFVGSWVMEALSAFDSSVLFEISNDGGVTWMTCNDVRNRAYGVVDFPNEGAALMWRFTAYRHNIVLDAVKMRPWYVKRVGSAQ